jgi:DNA-directed RNA polymerase specialized sigma24 family protein
MSMEFPQEFVRRLQRREQQAFSELYTCMVDRLYRYIAGRYHLDRQGMYDLIGDFFVKLRDRIDRVDPKQALEPRVWTVFRNFVADYFKTKKHSVRLD